MQFRYELMWTAGIKERHSAKYINKPLADISYVEMVAVADILFPMLWRPKTQILTNPSLSATEYADAFRLRVSPAI